MPPWNDVTLHDLAVRNMLRGGVHYRDVFDTNLPGIDWAMALVRTAFGWSYEVLRVADLVVMGLACALLGGWVRKCGTSPAGVAWFAAAAALFYPFTSEFCHCQRDPWMLLPALCACRLRLVQMTRENPTFRFATIEGFVWGLAVWVKPHVLVPAAVVWMVSSLFRRRRTILVEFLGLLFGGVLAGGLGLVWFVRSGAWPYFLEVFTQWNPEYNALTWSELPERLAHFVEFFPPWGLFHVAAIPLALLSLWECRIRQDSHHSARALLGAFYLAWLAQAVILQRGFDYVRVPDTLIAMAVLSARGWPTGFMALMWFLVVSGLLTLADTQPRLAPTIQAVEPGVKGLRFERHPILDPRVLSLWPRCWSEGSTPELRDELGWYVDVHCGTKWTDLNAVAMYLRTVDPPLHDRELTCWHDSTHPLYLMLDLDPSTRYMHYGTVFPLRGKLDAIRRAVATSPQRYVVSDLRRMTYDKNRANAPGHAGPHTLPAWFPRSQRDQFPWDQPIVFRSGRYLVHRISHPPRPEQIDIPDWTKLDELGPEIGP